MGRKIRRIIADYIPKGMSVFTSDDFFETKVIPSGDTKMPLIWTTETVPADCNDSTDG